MTQLFDVLKDTDATEEAIEEIELQKYLKKLSELPDWKKKKMEEKIRSKDFTLEDLIRIFDGEDKI